MHFDYTGSCVLTYHTCLSLQWLPWLGVIKIPSLSLYVQTLMAFLHKIILSRNTPERLTDLSPVLCDTLTRREKPSWMKNPSSAEIFFFFFGMHILACKGRNTFRGIKTQTVLEALLSFTLTAYEGCRDIVYISVTQMETINCTVDYRGKKIFLCATAVSG